MTVKQINANLCSFSINNLISGINEKHICFVVPSYQRGYRWTDIQVRRLLTDLYDFSIDKKEKNTLVGSFYCLQPIVVKRINDEEIKNRLGIDYLIDNDTEYYEIVDGQQRMITVFILLKYLLRRGRRPYSVEFERDKDKENGRRKLLNSLYDGFNTENVNDNYADIHYFLNAFKTISEWFLTIEQETGKSDVASLMETTVCSDTRVIWYELDSDADCYSIFKNINHGKIPLTDAELVKAMLLNSRNYSVIKKTNTGTVYTINSEIVRREQDRYARLWDEIQKALNSKGMWSFISGGENLDLPTNIDFLIRLIVSKEGNAELEETDYKYFSYFERKLANADSKILYVGSVFESLKNSFRSIQDWYGDYRLHNYIGMILAYAGKSVTTRIQIIIDLMNQYETRSKNSFVKYLKTKIKDEVLKGIITLEKIEEINYIENQKEIEKILMLFNIEELNEVQQKFNFYLDEDDRWSIEHIKAQHSEITKPEFRADYMKKEKESLEKLFQITNNAEFASTIKLILVQIEEILRNTPIEENQFKILAEQIDRDIDGFDDDDMHRLGNLALISKNNNSSLGNHPFFEKRESIIKWTSDPLKNIPYSTQKSFLKMYSSQKYSLDFTRWKKSDFKDLFERQKNMIEKFLKEDI